VAAVLLAEGKALWIWCLRHEPSTDGHSLTDTYLNTGRQAPGMHGRTYVQLCLLQNSVWIGYGGWISNLKSIYKKWACLLLLPAAQLRFCYRAHCLEGYLGTSLAIPVTT
jgi:hypothetical protein